VSVILTLFQKWGCDISTTLVTTYVPTIWDCAILILKRGESDYVMTLLSRFHVNSPNIVEYFQGIKKMRL
jgi:hypothetical protein